MKHKKISIVLVLILLMLEAGCNAANNQNEKNTTNITKISTQNMENINITDQVKKLLVNEKEVNKVKAVHSDKKLLIAVEIHHMDRFLLNEIEERLKKIVEEHYPKHEVDLSTDKKIFLELKKLEEQIVEKDMNKKDIEKEMKRIKSLSEELT